MCDLVAELFPLRIFPPFCFQDWDKDGGHSLIGSVTTSVHELTLRRPIFPILKNKKLAGELNCTNLQASHSHFAFQAFFLIAFSKGILAPPTNIAFAYQLNCSALKLAKMDSGIGAKSDPYFELRTNDDMRRLLYRSEIVMKDLNPKWKPFILDISPATGFLKFYDKFSITVFDWDANGTHDVIGFFTASLYELSLGEFQYPLMRNLCDFLSVVIFFTMLTRFFVGPERPRRSSAMASTSLSEHSR